MTTAETGRVPELHVRLRLPYAKPPRGLSGNSRVHWSVKARSTRQVREDVTVLARAAGLHRYQPGEVTHVRAQLVWAPGDMRKRDPDNLWPLAKVIFDGIARGRADLVGIDLVPDDSPEWMTKHESMILPPPAPAGMWVDLWIAFNNAEDDEK